MDFDEDSDYLNLDDILAQTKAVDCKFLLNIPGLQFLSPESSEDIVQGTSLLLPFWLAKTLYTYSMIDIELPKHYKLSYRETLEVEADVVDLHKAGPHYYEFGKLLMGLKREKGNNLEMYTEEGQRNKYRREEGETLADRRSIATSLLKTFHFRRHKLLDISTNMLKNTVDVRLFEARLDNMERRLYKLGLQQVNEINKWKVG